jgi:gluconolactonase
MTAAITALFALSAQGAPAATIADICGECVPERFATCGGFLEGAAFARDGTLWVVDVISGAIRSVSANGTCTQRATTGGAGNGARFHKDGRLFIADIQRGILAFDTKTLKLETVVDSFGGKKLPSANDMVFDDEGGLYFTEPHNTGILDPTGNVFYLPPAKGAALHKVATGLAFPNGIVLSADRKLLLVGQWSDKSIVAIPTVTNKEPVRVTYTWLRTVGGVGPDGMAQDAKGNLYWAIFGGSAVGVAGPDGVPIGTIRLPAGAGPYVTNMAFHGGWLYVTEATKGEIWRVRVTNRGETLYGQR